MEGRILRRLWHGFIQLHILYHAGENPVYGGYLLQELSQHGYEVSAGTLYPLLHELAASGLLRCRQEVVEGRCRKYYELTDTGRRVLDQGRRQARELYWELEGRGPGWEGSNLGTE